MKCEFDYCIYNADWICILTEVTINSLGMCEESVMVKVDEITLTECKDKQLFHMERELKSKCYKKAVRNKCESPLHNMIN